MDLARAHNDLAVLDLTANLAAGDPVPAGEEWHIERQRKLRNRSIGLVHRSRATTSTTGAGCMAVTRQPDDRSRLLLKDTACSGGTGSPGPPRRRNRAPSPCQGTCRPALVDTISSRPSDPHVQPWSLDRPASEVRCRRPEAAARDDQDGNEDESACSTHAVCRSLLRYAAPRCGTRDKQTRPRLVPTPH